MNAEKIQEQICGDMCCDMVDQQTIYRIDREDDPKVCKTCKHGAMWLVIGPNDIAISVSYEREEDAEDMAKQLSRAFLLGKKTGGHLLIEEITASAMAEMHGSAVEGFKNDLRGIVDGWD